MCGLFIWYVITNLKFQVASVNKYDPPLDLVAFRDNMTLLLYQLMQPQVLYDRLVQIFEFVSRFQKHFRDYN